MNDNPYYYAANAILEKLGRHHTTSRAQFDMSVQALMAQLGLPAYGSPELDNLDHGTIALICLCAFLKEHGGTIAAMTQAHQNLHQQPNDPLLTGVAGLVNSWDKP